MMALSKNTRIAVFSSTIHFRSLHPSPVLRIFAIGPRNPHVSFENHLALKWFSCIHCWRYSPAFFLLGGPALPKGSNRDFHTGCYLEGNTEVILRHHLQAGGQHKWRRLDDVSPWQEPQGKQSKELFHLGSRNLQVVSEPEELLIITMKTRRWEKLKCGRFTAGNQKRKECLGVLLKPEVGLSNIHLYRKMAF